MAWVNDIMPLAKWAFQNEDMRHQYIYASKARRLAETPGIENALEVTAVLALYQAALGMGYIQDETIGYEKAYPSATGKLSANPKRADLAFKDKGKGKNWAYIEVKYYGVIGKSAVKGDVKKLQAIQRKSQRWILIYRVQRTDRKSRTLENLLAMNFGSNITIHDYVTFPSVSSATKTVGLCEICLARVNNP